MRRKRRKREGRSVAERWIQKAIKHPGALRAAAERAGAITKKGTIALDWIREQARKKRKIGQRARLAQILREMSARRRGAS